MCLLSVYKVPQSHLLLILGDACEEICKEQKVSVFEEFFNLLLVVITATLSIFRMGTADETGFVCTLLSFIAFLEKALTFW